MYIFFSFSSESECVTYKRMISQAPLSSNKVPGTNFRIFYSLLTPPLTPEEELTLQTAKIIVILFISCVKARPPAMNNPIISHCQGHRFISFPGRLMPERKSFLSLKFWPLLRLFRKTFMVSGSSSKLCDFTLAIKEREEG